MSSFTIIIPTFKETAKVEAILSSFKAVRNPELRIFIANGNPGDETSALLAAPGADARVVELRGNPALYWSGLVNLGLRRLLAETTGPDFVVIMNADVSFENDLFDRIQVAMRKLGRGQLAALCHNGTRALSSGTVVRSWMLARTSHPFAGYSLSEVPCDVMEPVDYLPTRCTVFPMEALRAGGLVAEEPLPHYGADNEYTLRLNRLGYRPHIATDIRIVCDMAHTGNSVYHKSPPLRTRLGNLTSIKSVYNPIIRSRFVCLAYPPYARPTALLIYGLKGLVEVVLGGPAIRWLFRSKERGFSGTGAAHV